MNDDNDTGIEAGSEYPAGQLARAFVTALTHEDTKTRTRAYERVRRWLRVLGGMADGSVAVGSRTPVAGLPAWVTLEVVRGGFATGTAVAGGPPLPAEIDTARRVGVPARRRDLFAYYLTEAGQTELCAALDSGDYEVALPEEAALLVVAWLLRAGDRAAALELLDTLAPFADQLRFTPRPSDGPALDPALVSRQTVGEVRAALSARRPNDRVEAMREALTVWNPFADELLRHWLETVEAGQVAVRTPPDWVARGTALLARYRRLAEVHTRCTKHRKPKENLAILRAALEEVVAHGSLTPQRRGLLRHAVDAMVRRRGVPGDQRHQVLRARQLADASRPTHHALVRIAVERLAALPQRRGLPDREVLTRPVRTEEAAAAGVAAGSVMPEAVHRAAGRALAAPLDQLVRAGVVPSAEVLARLVPQLAAPITAAAYPDEALRALMAATYRAFRARRSVLLLGLSHQVRLDELPWVAALAPYRRDAATRERARDTLAWVGGLAMDAFPATIMPNPLVGELDTLARQAGLTIPLVEEIAADIFVGAFSTKFLWAAQLAAQVLAGTLYERYYGIDYQEIRDIEPGAGTPTSVTFAALCQRRAGAAPTSYSAAANGMVIEQAQILTTHNLAALVGSVGVVPASGWDALARRCLRATLTLVSRIHHNPYPLGMVKDAAYAWRQMLFFLSLTEVRDQREFPGWASEQVAAAPVHARARLAPALVGLRHAIAGGTVDVDGRLGEGRQFLGWAAGGHWMCGARPVPRQS